MSCDNKEYVQFRSVRCGLKIKMPRRFYILDNMEKALKASTIALIRKYKDEIKLDVPISKENETKVTLQLLPFFTDLDASLSFDFDEGIMKDRQLLNDVSEAVDDFNLDEGEHIDLASIKDILLG